MIKKILYILLLLLLYSCNVNKNIVEVNGKWELYNNKFILSEPSNTVELPDSKLYFSGSNKEIATNKNYEFGSIKQKLNVIPNNNYSLYFSGVHSASKIWIDGELLGEFGTIGKTLNSSEPDIRRGLINFTPQKKSVDLVIEFSHFYFNTKYLFKWIVLGNTSDIVRLYIKSQSKDYITFGLLIICSFLFLLIYIINRKNSYNLFLSLFSISYGLRSFLMKNTTLYYMIPSLKWEYIYMITKASELWALSFILLFFRSLFPEELDNIVTKIIVSATLVMSLLTFIPLEYFNKHNVLLVFHILVLISGVYIISRLLKTVQKYRSYAVPAMITVIFFFSTIVFDIFASRIMVIFDYYSAQFVFLLIITMFLMIGKNRSDTSRSVAHKQKMNLLTRETFSKFVPIEILSRVNNSQLIDRPPGDFILEAITMVYIDIRDFTKLSEGLSPTDNFKLINDFYSIVGEHVNSNHGYIESYGGDGVKAIFSDNPLDAINTTLNISRDVAKSSGIKIGMSIHFGKVVLGTIGGKNRIQATAISEVTRILGVMDNFNSKMGIEILITEVIYKSSNIHYQKTIYLGPVILKDEEEPVNLYQVIPDDFHIDPLFRESFSDAVDMIQKKSYSKALSIFYLAQRYNPTHLLTKYYVKQLENFVKLDQLTFTLKL
ncbi:MAG: adenylate/guanylate cyclase domain-containing protein [Spirochaetaceae bacterium]